MHSSCSTIWIGIPFSYDGSHLLKQWNCICICILMVYSSSIHNNMIPITSTSLARKVGAHVGWSSGIHVGIDGSLPTMARNRVHSRIDVGGSAVHHAPCLVPIESRGLSDNLDPDPLVQTVPPRPFQSDCLSFSHRNGDLEQEVLDTWLDLVTIQGPPLGRSDNLLSSLLNGRPLIAAA